MAEVVKLSLTDTIIPDDILIDILLRLPVRSLLFFRSVSKLWLNLIQNPNFIKLHSSRPNYDSVNPMLIVRSIEERPGILNKKIAFTLLYDDDTRAYENDGPLDLVSPTTSWRFFDTVLLLGPCNGLFCRTDLAEVLVFNPATRRCRKISPSSSDQSYVDRYVGFGFDHVSNDYKVVRFDQTMCIKLNFDNNNDNGEDNITRRYDPFILVFDLNKESLKRLKLPDSSNEDFLDLLILNESLSLIVRTNNSTNCDYDTFEIWAMKEYGVYESWRKLYKIPAANFDRPLCFGKDGEFLLQRNDGQLVSYNLNSRAIKEFQVQGVRGSMCALRYKETLASLK